MKTRLKGISLVLMAMGAVRGPGAGRPVEGARSGSHQDHGQRADRNGAHRDGDLSARNHGNLGWLAHGRHRPEQGRARDLRVAPGGRSPVAGLRAGGPGRWLASTPGAGVLLARATSSRSGANFPAHRHGLRGRGGRLRNLPRPHAGGLRRIPLLAGTEHLNFRRRLLPGGRPRLANRGARAGRLDGAPHGDRLLRSRGRSRRSTGKSGFPGRSLHHRWR
jgi:hypothetical protein